MGSKEQIIKELEQLFDNNYDCYTSILKNDGSWDDDIPGISKGKFIEIVMPLLNSTPNDKPSVATGDASSNADD